MLENPEKILLHPIAFTGAPHLLLDLQSAAFLLGNAEITLRQGHS